MCFSRTARVCIVAIALNAHGLFRSFQRAFACSFYGSRLPTLFWRSCLIGADSENLYCYVHLFGDFGTRGLPGTFKIFFVDVVVQMARSELVLTLPLAIYVDDSAHSGLIGSANDGAGASEKRVGIRAARARAEVTSH